MKPKEQNIITVVTHSGNFHADDVFGVASLTLLFEARKTPFKITRSRDKKVIQTGDIVLDVGGIYDEKENFFDHHQIGGAGERQNGIPYASFGLIWRKFGVEIAGGRKFAEKMDSELVQYIDAGDNGYGELKCYAASVFPYTIERAVVAFNLGWLDGAADSDGRFFDAVKFARGVLIRELKIVKEIIEGEKFLQ